ncbi:MAG: enoyl-CoA hydratase/isomerase family protein [Rhodobacteraceae bacterium]|nr:enoyl-CoA hydratase/isomerase family protein [Paracoccaceae bacterium]
MPDINIRITGKAGRITLTRPQALNAVTCDMCGAIDVALRAWQDDPAVELVIFDAEGDKAFCAGGDIAELYETGIKGNFTHGRMFWAKEYRLNALIFEYPKPVVSFLQGFTMGGGVGIGCHGSHRIVGESSQIAMPECGIGLVPDVGGTLMLALAPGRLGEYLGTTGARMGAADAILSGFADMFIPQADWLDLIADLEISGHVESLKSATETAPSGALADQQAGIDRFFAGETFADIVTLLKTEDSPFTDRVLKALGRVAPLSAACTIDMVHRLRGSGLTIRKALELEYRFTYRALEHGDFLEGIRARIIDKDHNPAWRYANGSVPATRVSQMLMPLGTDTLTFEKEPAT